MKTSEFNANLQLASMASEHAEQLAKWASVLAKPTNIATRAAATPPGILYFLFSLIN